MHVNITIHFQKEKTQIYAKHGAIVASILREHGFLHLLCGGNGRCGKCKIYANTEPSIEERELLSAKELNKGIRLACYTRVREGLEITIPKAHTIRVLTTLTNKKYCFAPIVQEIPFTVEAATVEDNRSDIRKILETCGAVRHCLPLTRLAELPSFVHKNKTGYLLLHGKTLLNFSANSIYYAVSIDIGTTTISAHLTNLHTQEIIAVHGEPNAQGVYGADVISRIQYDSEWRNANTIRRASTPLRTAIVQQINDILLAFMQEQNIDDVAIISITGNTTMLHFLCGFPTEYIGHAPFTPVFLREQKFTAVELGLETCASIFLLPGISSFVGADIIASMLAAEAWRKQKPFLLLDIGTNAETVLGVNDVFYACSAAAGPCFEGGNMSCGMTGQDGAIDKVFYDKQNGFTYTTIGHSKARGICGSGIISIMRLLLDFGLVDESGYLEVNDHPLCQYIRDEAFYITETIYFSQKDIRELQMAKAAIRAGIDIMLKKAGIAEEELHCMYLAGGFGSAIDPYDAARVGLFPPHLAEKSVVLGNTAATGALRYITEKKAQRRANMIQKNTRYIELSCYEEFTNVYVERMFF